MYRTWIEEVSIIAVWLGRFAPFAKLQHWDMAIWHVDPLRFAPAIRDTSSSDHSWIRYNNNSDKIRHAFQLSEFCCLKIRCVLHYVCMTFPIAAHPRNDRARNTKIHLQHREPFSFKKISSRLGALSHEKCSCIRNPSRIKTEKSCLFASIKVCTNVPNVPVTDGTYVISLRCFSTVYDWIDLGLVSRRFSNRRPQYNSGFFKDQRTDRFL